MSGMVYIVGAGPGDPELLTQKAARLLRSADVVLHDDLVSAEVLALAPPTAERRNVGKRCGEKRITQEEIHALMMAHARQGKLVVRLKGGDPAVFGRTGEELDALRAAGVRAEVVPGITAALAAAAAAQIPLTDRRAASKLVLLTAHSCRKDLLLDWPDKISPDSTLVVYMSAGRHAAIAGKLTRAGLAFDTPCLIVSRGSMPGEKILKSTLSRLANVPRLPAPSILIIGEVAAQASRCADIPSFDHIVSRENGERAVAENGFKAACDSLTDIETRDAEAVTAVKL